MAKSYAAAGRARTGAWRAVVFGTVTREAAGARVTLSRDLAAEVDAVWAALTRPDRLRHWLAEVTGGEVAAGGTFELAMDPDAGEVARCTVVDFDPPSRLELDWDHAGEGVSRLAVLLEPAGRTTRLTLAHAGLAADGSVYGAGWHAHLDLLGAIVEGREPPSWRERYDAALPVYRAMVRPHAW